MFNAFKSVKLKDNPATLKFKRWKIWKKNSCLNLQSFNILYICKLYWCILAADLKLYGENSNTCNSTNTNEGTPRGGGGSMSPIGNLWVKLFRSFDQELHHYSLWRNKSFTCYIFSWCCVHSLTPKQLIGPPWNVAFDLSPSWTVNPA